ncbi:uncharacterized protein LOC110330325 [Mus pahari]|uniref:uncharacterized protein LOC110330325 n=1 Tax=Mus pahari TaxID=10093 RepID=UPI001114D37C|nr:uncharacterized protein LOC110330325 [Mus pahari]
MSIKQASVFLLIQLMCYIRPGACGKVLVWPTEYSHWMNIKIILDELVQRGHEVTVLVSSASILIGSSNESSINFEIYSVPLSKDELEYAFQNWIGEWTYDFKKHSFWTFYSKLQKIFSEYSDIIESFCKEVVWNKSLMKKLQGSKFDVILADGMGPCGELLAELLNTPLVYSLRFTPGYKYEKYSGGLPLPTSYVPVVLSELSDHMTFVERVKNMLQVLYFDFWFQPFNEKSWSQFYSDVLGRPTTLTEMMGKADIWLIRTFWDLEFPHPFLPNFDFVGGLHCKPAKPLPKEMEEFVQSSGEHGVVVFSLGSMVKNMKEEKANVVASALAQIPQKVLWRFDGKKPDTLGSNTRLYKWIPQNDLLGHPKTKAFVAHGGTNGIYEAMYHGIPIVGIPLFADQHDNINHIVAKGAAVKVDFETMSTTDLLAALKTVINDPFYKENALRLSRIHHDQPMKPLDRAVFWIEYVMRNKGAKHLRPALHDLSWFQYHSLDVIGFLLVCVVAVVFIIAKCCLFCCHKTANVGKKKKEKAIVSDYLWAQQTSNKYSLKGLWWRLPSFNQRHFSNAVTLWKVGLNSTKMPVKMTAALFLLLLQLSGFFGSGTGGKVLVWPMEFSHWLNLRIILDELLKKGHEVIVLRPSASFSYEVDNTSAIEFETYPTSYSLSELEEFFWDSLRKYIYELPKQSFWGYFLMLQEMVWVDSEYHESLCKDVVFNKELMTKLQKSRFDVILADPFIPCGDLLAEVLKIPLVYSLRFFPGSTYEKYSGGLPLPPSYVPVVMSELSDRMTFMERVRNVIYMLCFDFWFQTFNEKKWNQLYTDVLGRPTTLSETMAKADIWLIRTYWDLEFPHPVLPNFDFVGGLHCRPAKPLPKEIEDFVQSSGEHGVVVFSLGSMVGSITEERANVIAAGLAQIPQKVSYRVSAINPHCHPKTRAFITHGGTNGIYEAIYHGIPVVGIPLFGDQYDNIVHLKAKGAAVRLDFLTMSSTDLLTALKTVTNDPSYKENAMRLSRIYHDQPVKPLDRAVFWIEFVMRHKGAKHLRVAAHDLSWVQYHSLDVIGFLLACVLTVLFILTKCCLFCYQKLTKAGRKKKGE